MVLQLIEGDERRSHLQLFYTAYLPAHMLYPLSPPSRDWLMHTHTDEPRLYTNYSLLN